MPSSTPPTRCLAFDIEIARPIPDGAADWSAFRPLGISCAATLTSDRELKLWSGQAPGGGYAPQMSQSELAQLVRHLQGAAAAGYQIVTWNGLGFDFHVMAEESGERAACRQLASDHIDMMFHVFCLKGFAIGLDKAAKGMRLPGKTEGMSGSLAPQLWEQGEYQKVLDYVAQDVATTLQIFQAAEKARRLTWVASTGKIQEVPLPDGWLPAARAMQLPKPDVSWMKNPWSRSKFTGWLDS